MNSVLSYIAGLVVVLLIAALVGPTFVDWNRFRSQIETQGSKLTGRELKIGGDIGFVVLPAPHLTLNSVSLSNLPGGENSDFARFGQIDAEVALAPLFSGEISVTSVTVTRPQIHLEIMRDGRSNWNGLVADSLQEDGLFGLSSVSLEKATFEDGTVTYSDHRDGSNWRVDHIEGSVIATSLLGPVRANLKFDTDEIPLALRLAIGNFGGRKAFPITAELQALAQPAKLLFSGVSTGGRLDGTGSFEYGSTKVEGGQKPKAPLRVEAGVVVGDSAATFRNLVVAMAGTTLKGDAQAEWKQRPTANIRLGGEALTLDPLVERLGEFMAGAKVPFGALATLPVPDGIDAKADVKVASLLVHDVLVKDAALALSMTNGTLSIDRAAGDIGSGTQFELAGALSPGEEGGRFDGKVKATTRNMAALAGWLASLRAMPGQAVSGETLDARSGRPVPQILVKEPRRPFSIASNIQLTRDRLDFNDLTAAYAMTPDAADLKGDLSFTERDKRPLLRGALAAKSFDLDPLIALWPETAPKPLALLDANDLDLSLTADKLTVAGRAVAGLDTSMAVAGGELDIRRFAATDLAGAKVTLAGTLSGATKGELGALRGKLHGEMEAEKTDGLLALAGIDAPGLQGPVQLTLDSTAGEAGDSQSRLDMLMLKGTIGGSRVDAVLKRGHTADGKADRIDLIANATNGDGRLLLSQLGLAPDDGLSGAGTASLQLSGATDKPYDTTLRVNVGQGTFNAKGGLADPLGSPGFTGHVDISASGMSQVLAALGVPERFADFAAVQAGGPSFVLSSDMKSGTGVLALSGLEAVAGNFHLSGEATWQRPQEAGKLPTLTGKFQANTLDLTSIFATDVKDTDAIWPTTALDWSVLGTFEGDVGLKVDTLKLGTLRLDQSDMRLALAQSVLSVAPFTAKFADGGATIGARIEGGKSGEPGIGLTVALDGADIEKLGPQISGASFGTGRADIDAQLEGQGRSWLALMSSISGKGTFETRNAGVAPLDVPGFSDGLKKLKSLDEFAALQAQTLDKGNTPARGLDGDFVVKDGIARMGKDGIELRGGKGKLVAMLDLGRLAADAELDVTLDDPAGAPPVSIVAAGKLGAIDRREDTGALQNFISKQIIAQAAQDMGVDFIPKELKNLLGLSDQELKAKGPAVAGIPLPMKRPEAPKAALQ